jgi:hypothetical protein
MHDYILGFVCFMAGALFVVIVGLPLLDPQREDDSAPQNREHADAAPVEPRRWPWHDPDRHAAWPTCDCPTEAYHTKYYPDAGVR